MAAPSRPSVLVIGALTALTGLFVLCLFVAHGDKIFGLPKSLAATTPEDLPAFWRASALALQGVAADAYDPAIFRTAFPQAGAGLLFLNPPHFLLLIWPLALVDYGTAKLVWIALSLGAYAGAARWLTKTRAEFFVVFGLLALSPGAYANALVWQLAPFAALALIGGLLLSDKRPLIAGLLLALMTVKPQYGLLIPVVLAAQGRWRTLSVGAAATALLIFLSIAVFGLEVWRAYLDSVTHVQGAHALGLRRDLVAFHQTVAKLGLLDPAARFGAQAAVTMLLGAMVFLAGRRWPAAAASGFALSASVSVAPSVWVYDWPIVTAGLVLLLRTQSRLPIGVLLLAYIVFAAPLPPLGLRTFLSSTVSEIALLMFLIVTFLVIESRRESDARDHAGAVPAAAPSAT